MVNDTPARLDDDIDVGIVRAVLQDARATLAELSAAVGLSVSAVQARLRRLEARGVITGYRALVDAEAVGKPLAAFVEITPLDPGQPDNAQSSSSTSPRSRRATRSRATLPTFCSCAPHRRGISR